MRSERWAERGSGVRAEERGEKGVGRAMLHVARGEGRVDGLRVVIGDLDGLVDRGRYGVEAVHRILPRLVVGEVDPQGCSR